MKRQYINDTERSLWVDNDEGLYLWWKQSRLPKWAFVKQNRQEITDVIMSATKVRQAHYTL